MAINLTTNDNFSLPPQVTGKVRGLLIFKISEIVLYRAPTTVLVQLQWWGENIKNVQNLGPIKIYKPETKKSIHSVNLVYNICTTLNLFYSYLSQCEPIKAEIFTAISNLKLGSAKILIPKALIQNKLPQTQATSICKIINDDGDDIGDISINLQLNFKDDDDDLPASDRITTSRLFTHSKPHELICENDEKKNLHKSSAYLKKLSKYHDNDDSSITSKNSIEKAVTSRENVLKYLHGEDMNSDLEKQALRDIQNLSPASSLIALADAEHCLTKNTSWTHCPSHIGSKIDTVSVHTLKDSSISKYIDEISKITDNKQHAMESNAIPKINKVISESSVLKPKAVVVDALLNHVDSIRVTVQTLTLTRAGLRIVLGLENLPLVTISPQVTFFVEYAMPSLMKQENAANISRIRICAKSKDGQDVPFNRQSIHKVPISAILSNVSNPAIDFNVYYRKVSQRQAKHLGQCRITLEEIISSPKLHSTRKCPIITNQTDKNLNKKNSGSNHKMPEKVESDNVFSDVIGFGGILAGHLTVKVELGSGLLHFGKHFLEAFSANQENISIPSSITNSEPNDEYLASTTFNAPILDTRNRPLNCAVYKQQQVLPQDRCTVCKDFYTKSLSHKTQHCSYEASNVRTSKKCNENRISYQEVKNPTPRKVVNKQAQSMKPAVCCAEQVILKEQKDNEIVTDSDDGKFVNTDLRGGKDMICNKDQNDKKNILTKKSFQKKSSYFRKDRGKVADTDIETRNDEDSILLHGLLFVNEARGLEPQLLPQAYCLVNRGLCPGTGGSSKHIMCDGKYFQYLETFPLLCNRALMERCHSGHLIIEVWLKGPGPAQKLVGVASLPLHAFFVAYHDPNMVRYLEKVKLPVISVDGWIPLLSPISGTVSGEIQALLAIGTEKQLEELRISRNLKPDIVQMLDDSPNHQQKHKSKRSNKHEKKNGKILSCSIGVNTSPIVVRQFATSISDINSGLPGSPNSSEELNQKNYNTVHTQTTNEEVLPKTIEESDSTMIAENKNSVPIKVQQSFGNLSTFVSQLMQNIPQDTSFLTNFGFGLTSEKSSAENTPRIKQTSDLLADLQKALEHIPQAFAAGSDDGMNQRSSDDIISNNLENIPSTGTCDTIEEDRSSEVIECFKASIEIDQALRLLMITTSSKKCHKRSKCKSKTKISEVAPSTYVTFPALFCSNTAMIQAPEGPVVATEVIPNTCSPIWKQKFEVALPVDLLKTDPKQLVFKIWRKRGSNTNIDLNIDPASDVIIGFAVVDLSILLSGLPSICGWFNITDVANRCNGQIKISINPLEDLDKYTNDASYCCSDNDTIHSFNSANEDNLTIVRLTKSKEKMMEMVEEARTKMYGKVAVNDERMDTNESSVQEIQIESNANNEQVAADNPDVNSNLENIQRQKSGGQNYDSTCPRFVNNSYESKYNENQQDVTPNLYHNLNNEHHLYQPVTKSKEGFTSTNHSIITDIINHNPNQSELDEDSLNTSSLSRVLKRKFTELHEITQRLRSRLLDVTKDDDDEFERDLNTVSDEKEYGIRPEDFVSLVHEADPPKPEILEDENNFENLANNYQNLLAVKENSDVKLVDQVGGDDIQVELAMNRDILSQKKCNINTLLQKLTLLVNPQDSPPAEKHVKFNSDVEVLHNESSNIFELIPGSEFNSEPQSATNIIEDESSIESGSTSKSGSYLCKSPEEIEAFDHFEENLNHAEKFYGKSQYKYSSQQSDSRTHGACFPQITNARILRHHSLENKTEEVVTNSPELTPSQEPSDDEDDDNISSRTVDIDVREVITNILKITDCFPNMSKDTGIEDEDRSSKRSNMSPDEGEKKDQDTTGIFSDFCES